MTNKLGMHNHGMQPGIIQAVELLQPRTVTMMDPTAQELRDIRSVASPIIVVRKYEHGKSFQEVSPGWWAEEYYRMVGDAVGDDLIALGWNEPFGHDHRNLCAPFDEWNRRFTERCRELGPMDGGALAMATGNWTGADDRYKITDDFPLTCELARYFLLHEYCWPTLQDGVPWHTLRYRAWIHDLVASGKEDFYIIISEAGLTQAVIPGRPDHGWRSGGPEGVTEDSYIATIDWYNAELCQDWRVLGCCLYDYAGSHYGWETFEQLGLEGRIFQIQAPEVPEPPEPPNGDEHMIEIYDYDGNLRDWDWLRAEFGDVQVHNVESRFAIRPGERVYKVSYLRAKTGYASCLINTRDQDGQNVVGETVIFGWPAAEPHGLPDNGHNWTPNGVYGYTNETGDVGPGMGTGAYYSPADGERGPHFCWVYGLPSDYVDGLGMLAMTNHNHVDVGYREVIAGETEPPTPPEEPTEILEVLQAIKADTGQQVTLLEQILEAIGQQPPELPPPVVAPFRGEYFNNISLSGAPAYTRDDPEINFFWGEDTPPAPGLGTDNFSVRWTGQRTFEAGTYRFHTFTDDGVRLWVDGNLIINKWVDQAPTQWSASVALTAGQHSIKMEYYERGGGATARLWWDKVSTLSRILEKIKRFLIKK